jgi:hypothetical protein
MTWSSFTLQRVEAFPIPTQVSRPGGFPPSTPSTGRAKAAVIRVVKHIQASARLNIWRCYLDDLELPAPPNIGHVDETLLSSASLGKAALLDNSQHLVLLITYQELSNISGT